jgi:hypothetical protein
MRLVIKEIVINDKDHQPNLCTGTLDQFLSPSWMPCERHNYSAPCVRTCMYACMCVRERELESPLDVRKEIIHIYIYIYIYYSISLIPKAAGTIYVLGECIRVSLKIYHCPRPLNKKE